MYKIFWSMSVRVGMSKCDVGKTRRLDERCEPPVQEAGRCGDEFLGNVLKFYSMCAVNQ